MPLTSRIDVTPPTGGTSGDWYLFHVRSEGGAVAPTVTIDDAGFTVLATGGEPSCWDYLWQRPYDGDEPDVWHVDGGEIYVQATVLLVRGVDGTTPFVVGAIDATPGDKDDFPTHTVTAVASTVDGSLVVIGFGSYYGYNAGPVELDPPAPTLILSADTSTPLRVWTLEVPTAATVGPWTIDRSHEDINNPAGVTSWTVVAQPVTSDPLPTVEASTVVTAFPYDVIPPSPRTLIGPNGEVVVIQGDTQAEQDAAVAAQLAAWAATSGIDTYLAAVDSDLVANAVFLASPGSSDPQLVAATEQLQRIHAALKEQYTA